jgi:hypothetical protein
MSALVVRRKLLALTALALVGALVRPAVAAPMSFEVPLTGDTQVPPVKTAGHGSAALTYDPDSRALTWSVTYADLSGPVSMAHFHGPAAAGKNGPVVIWLTKRGAAAPSPITGQATLTQAEAEQFAAGQWYINVHTKDHPSGEIRGQVMPPKG